MGMPPGRRHSTKPQAETPGKRSAGASSTSCRLSGRHAGWQGGTAAAWPARSAAAPLVSWCD
jgi:hypothetical protein